MKIEKQLMQVFPVKLRNMLTGVDWFCQELEEIRLRVGQPILFVYGDHHRYLRKSGDGMTEVKDMGVKLQRQDMEEMLLYLCEYSRYAYAKQMQNGFVTLAGGIRVGIAGEYLGQAGALEHPMFFNIRIPSERKGCASWLLPWILEEEIIHNTLIVAAPGAGKTTVLRDLIREMSEVSWCKSISVMDERMEIAACQMGVPLNDVGNCSDIFSGIEKSVGCMQAIRTMAPQIIAVDEIGSVQDGEALAYAMRCGCSVFATMHAGSMEEYRGLIAMREGFAQLQFQRILWIKKEETGSRSYRLYNKEGELLCARP